EDFTFEVDGETDKVVEVWDDQTDPDNPVSLGEATWNVEGTATEFDYSLVHQGVVGETVEFTNTAWIEVTGENPEASTTVDVTIDPAKPGDPKPDAKLSLPDTGAPIAGLAALALL